jgi:hypothetical protein
MDLRFLRELYELPPPFASVYLATARDAEDAKAAVALRWRHAGDELAAAGADQATIAAIEEVALRPGDAPPGRVIFAADGRIGHSEDLAVPPPQDTLATWGPLPDTLPFLLARVERVPHVKVLVDRTGADIVALGDRPAEFDVHGREWPVKKVREGGWSEQRYQRSAVETWRDNAKQVAEVVREAADEVQAELIIIGGDVRAREMLLEHLSGPLEGRAVVAEHGARGAESRQWETEVGGLLHRRPEARKQALVEAFHAEAPRRPSVQGLGPVVEALRADRVETLLVTGEPPGDLWYGDRAGELATLESELHTLGVDRPRHWRAGAVLVRAAVLTGAELEPIEPERLDLTDQVGALLRF